MPTSAPQKNDLKPSRRPATAVERFMLSPAFGAALGLFALLFGGIVLFERVSSSAAYLADRTLLRQAHSIHAARTRLAAERTARLIEQRMATTPVFRTREELLAYSLEAVQADGGLYCEFGVATGGTINFLARQHPQVTFHGFDSFEGLPVDWRTGFSKGTFARAELPEVRSNVVLYKGWFNETLPGFLDAEPDHVSFLHLDADLYSSTKTVLDATVGRLRPGSVLQFDEYFNYPGWQEGEFLAFEELVSRHDIEFEYLGYCDGPSEYEQVAVRILRVGESGSEVVPVEQRASTD